MAKGSCRRCVGEFVCLCTGGHGKSNKKYTNLIVKMDRLPDPPGIRTKMRVDWKFVISNHLFAWCVSTVSQPCPRRLRKESLIQFKASLEAMKLIQLPLNTYVSMKARARAGNVSSTAWNMCIHDAARPQENSRCGGGARNLTIFSLFATLMIAFCDIKSMPLFRCH